MRDVIGMVAVPVADSWGMHGDVGVGWWFVMVIGMVAFWGAVILGIIWLLRDARQRSHTVAGDTPEDVLRRRFADGAISAEEFEERLRLLADSDPAAGRPSDEEPGRTPAGAGV